MKPCLILLLLFQCAQAQVRTVQDATWSLTEVMFHDVVNPPAAARFYAYSLLTGYQIASALDHSLPAFYSQFRNYPAIPAPEYPEKIEPRLAVIYGILETGRRLIPSGYLLAVREDSLLSGFLGLDSIRKEASLTYARRVAAALTDYARGDGYFALSALKRYEPRRGPGNWEPTPPEYMAAVEPHWNTIRTFFLDSATQCSAGSMEAFDTGQSSRFRILAREVYETGRNLTEEEKQIANFWDCNPFAVQFEGHMSVGLKKISPGGHWMGITGIVCSQAGLDLSRTVLLHTLIALTLHDSFICCWTEKYRNNRIRPETVIHRYIDERWQPFLQTPPFPEYPSGHSVISTAAAEVLTRYLGDSFSFRDTVESYLGLPPRNFSSFRQAAAEARISRLYGGIHFRDAVENGGEQGRQVGLLIIRRIGLQPFRK